MTIARAKAEKFWSHMDPEGTGTQAVDAVKSAIGSHAKCKAVSADKLFEGHGGDNVTKEEFLTLAATQREVYLREVFSRMDTSGDGQLNGKEMMDILTNDSAFDAEDVDALFTKVSNDDGDSKVSCQEFVDAAM